MEPRGTSRLAHAPQDRSHACNGAMSCGLMMPTRFKATLIEALASGRSNPSVSWRSTSGCSCNRRSDRPRPSSPRLPSDPDVRLGSRKHADGGGGPSHRRCTHIRRRRRAERIEHRTVLDALLPAQRPEHPGSASGGGRCQVRRHSEEPDGLTV